MPQTLDPTDDIVFKLLFAHPDRQQVLIALLNAVLRPPVPIVAVTVLNPEIGRDHVLDKPVQLDVRCRLADGTLVDVEMQAYRQSALIPRVLYYWARLYGGQLEQGQSWQSLKPCISVVFLTFDLLRNGLCHNIFELRDTRTGARLTDHQQLHLIQLPGAMNEGEGLAMEHWVRFLKAKDEREREEIAAMDPMIRQANDVLGVLAKEPSVQELLRLREDAERTRATWREDALQEGRAAGHAAGHAEGQVEILASQVTSKFGGSRDEHCERLAKLSPERLQVVAVRLLTADSLEDLLGAT